MTLAKASFLMIAGLALAGSLASHAAPAARPAAAAPALTVTCPASLEVQYQRIGPFGPDGAAGAIDDFQPVFEPRTPVRLIAAQLAAAHGGSGKPSEVLPPDELSFTPGRPARWSLWNGAAPEPKEEIFVLCEYEGGLQLQRSLGMQIRSCTLASAGQRPGPKSTTQRVVLTRAVFSCR